MFDRGVASRLIPGFLVASELVALRERVSEGNWIEGRLGTGYEKWAIESEPLVDAITERALDEMGRRGLVGFDRFMLRYDAGDEAPEHVDPALREGLIHLRLNALISAGEGGQFTIDGRAVALAEGDAIVFRPDIDPHAVTELRAGERLMLSIGCNFETE